MVVVVRNTEIENWGWGESLNKRSRAKRGVLVLFCFFNLLLKSEEKREFLLVEQKNPEILKKQPYDIPALKIMPRFLERKGEWLLESRWGVGWEGRCRLRGEDVLMSWPDCIYSAEKQEQDEQRG